MIAGAPLPSEIAELIARWERRGRRVPLDEGHELFAVVEGSGPDLILVHGFPSSGHDFAACLTSLTPDFRVTVFDQLGFGLSDKPPAASYSLLDQARRAGELAKRLELERAWVVGHDMGLTVAVEMLCRHHAGTLGFELQGLVLCNGSHLVELANITKLQKDLMTDEGAQAFAKHYDPERFAEMLGFVWAQKERTPEVDRRAIAYFLSLGGGLDVLGAIARYNLEREKYKERWRPILRETDVPIRVVWGDRDPIAILEIGRRLAEMAGTPLITLEGLGHWPQMEDPAHWAAAVRQAIGA